MAVDLTSQFVNGIFTNFALIFEEAYATTKVWWPQIAELVPSNTEQNIYPLLAELPGMREWLGPRIIRNLQAVDYTLKNKDFERTYSLPKNKIADDQYGVYRNHPKYAGWAVAKWPDQMLARTIKANPTSVDGLSFFNANHLTNLVDTNDGVQSNSYGLALTANNYATVRAGMMGLYKPGGDPLGIMPNLLVVPPQLEYTARTILNADFIAAPTIGNLTGNVGATTNVLKGSADLLVIPELADDPTAWYLLDVTRPVMPFLFQLRQAAEFVWRNRPDDERVFMNKEFLFGVDARGNTGVSLWFLAAKSKP